MHEPPGRTKKVIDILPYDPMRHRCGVREVLAKNGWQEHYIAGQLAALDVLSDDPLPGRNGKVCVCEVEDRLSGYVCVEYREWNRLGQVQGLAVDPAHKRRGIASELLHRAEEFVQAEGGRGIYVDTPVANRVGRSFYEEGLDGVTYLKLFPK